MEDPYNSSNDSSDNENGPINIPLTSFRRSKGSENDRRMIVLAKENIVSDLLNNCERVRKSYTCENSFNCKDLFSFSSAINAVIELRKYFYPEYGTTAMRLALLFNTLRTMQVPERELAGKSTIRFRIQDKIVCKSFYKMASGMTTKMFDSTVAVIEKTANQATIDRINRYYLIIFNNRVYNAFGSCNMSD